MGSSRDGRLAGKAVHESVVEVATQAGNADDLDYLVLGKQRRKIRILEAGVFMTSETWNSGVKFTLEEDDGTTETALMSVSTASGDAPGDYLELTADAEPVVDTGFWLQVRLEDQNSADAIGAEVVVQYVYEDISIGHHEA